MENNGHRTESINVVNNSVSYHLETESIETIEDVKTVLKMIGLIMNRSFYLELPANEKRFWKLKKDAE